jgi:hypothetical protein
VANAFISKVSTQAMHIKSKFRRSAAFASGVGVGRQQPRVQGVPPVVRGRGVAEPTFRDAPRLQVVGQRR